MAQQVAHILESSNKIMDVLLRAKLWKSAVLSVGLFVFVDFDMWIVKKSVDGFHMPNKAIQNVLTWL